MLQIDGLNSLRLDDQQKIKDKLLGALSALPAGAAPPPTTGDYSVEYAKSGRSKCKGVRGRLR